MPSTWCPAQKSRDPCGNPKEACRSQPPALHRPLRVARWTRGAPVFPPPSACTPDNRSASTFASAFALAPAPDFAPAPTFTSALAVAPTPAPAPTPEAVEATSTAATTTTTSCPFPLLASVSLRNGAPLPRNTGVLVMRERFTASGRPERAPAGRGGREGGFDDVKEMHRWRLVGGGPEGCVDLDPVAADTAAPGFAGNRIGTAVATAAAVCAASAFASAAAFLSFLLCTTRLTISGS